MAKVIKDCEILLEIAKEMYAASQEFSSEISVDNEEFLIALKLQKMYFP